MIQKQMGRSMIEMLGVLAIIGVLSIGGLYAYRQAMMRYKSVQIIDFINRILFQTADVCTEHSCPITASIVESQKYLCNALGNEMCSNEFMGANWVMNYTSDTYFQLCFFNLPSAVCQHLVAHPFENLKQFHIGAAGGAYGPEFTETERDKMRQDCVNDFVVNSRSQICLRW